MSQEALDVSVPTNPLITFYNKWYSILSGLEVPSDGKDFDHLDWHPMAVSGAHSALGISRTRAVALSRDTYHGAPLLLMGYSSGYAHSLRLQYTEVAFSAGGWVKFLYTSWSTWDLLQQHTPVKNSYVASRRQAAVLSEVHTPAHKWRDHTVTPVPTYWLTQTSAPLKVRWSEQDENWLFTSPFDRDVQGQLDHLYTTARKRRIRANPKTEEAKTARRRDPTLVNDIAQAINVYEPALPSPAPTIEVTHHG